MSSFTSVIQFEKIPFSFVQKCLFGDSHTVRFAVNNGVYFGRMFSPIGRNVAFLLFTV